MSVNAVGKDWGDIRCISGNAKTLVFTVRDNSGTPIAIPDDATYELWFLNVDPTKPTDTWTYTNDLFAIVNRSGGQISVLLKDVDTAARAGSRYRTQLWRTDTDNVLGSGFLAVLVSSRQPDYPINNTPPGGILNVVSGGSGANLSATSGIWYQATAGAPVTPIPLDTDGTLAGDSDLRIATQKAVKTYVDAHGGGAVSSVFGRTGAVAAQSGDYTAAQVGADASGAAATAQSNAESFATSAVATETTRAETAEGLLVQKTTSVAGHALSSNVAIQASDLTNGVTGTGAVVLATDTELSGTLSIADSSASFDDAGNLVCGNVNGNDAAFGTLNGNTITAGTGTLTLSTFGLTAVQSGNIATTAYVDLVAQGMNPKPVADVATTTTLPACTYANGTAGVGATLTGNSNGALAAIDGITLTSTLARVLVNNQAAPAQNGLYNLTQVGDGSHPFILTRNVDMDSATEFVGQLAVDFGTANLGSLWLSSIGPDTAFTVGTTSVTFTRMNKATDLQQGNGIGISGNTVAIDTSVTVDKTTAQTLSNKTLTGPTLTAPLLGTPASGIATNLTGTAAGLTAGNVTTNANLTGPITSSGNATSIAAQTGTGTTFAMATSPTFTTPVLGAATGTSVNLSGNLTAAAVVVPVGTLNATIGSSAAALVLSGVATVSIGAALLATSFTVSGSGPALSASGLAMASQPIAGATTISASGVITSSNLTGTNTGDQTITLTGDATGSGTGSFAVTIAAGAVTLAKMATINTSTILGRATAGTGNVEDLTASQAGVIIYGNGFLAFTGPTASTKTKTVRDASDTILELGGSYTPTGTYTSMTFVTPILGTPTSGTLANCTGFPAASLSGTALPAAIVTSSLTAVGTLQSPTLVTPALGAPASGTLTNCTGLPASGIAAGTLGANITYGENTELILVAALSADGKYCGITEAGTAANTLVFGDICYFVAASSKWDLAKADSSTTSGPVRLGMCVLAASSNGATKMLLIGKIRADSLFPTLTIGAPAYISSSTAGSIVTAAPTATDSVTRILGYGTTTHELYFNPDSSFYTHI